MIAGALVLPEITVGMIAQSATRKFSTPRTRSRSSTTAFASLPIGPEERADSLPAAQAEAADAPPKALSRIHRHAK